LPIEVSSEPVGLPPVLAEKRAAEPGCGRRN
jgi:hypothetical protein